MLADLEATALVALVEKVADFTLRIDAQGAVSEVSVSSDDLRDCVDQTWVGQDWFGLVGEEGAARLRQLRREALAGGAATPRADVIHPLGDGAELPVQYRAVALDQAGSLLVLGQDLRGVASLRQQLLNAQQALEQDYWRLRRIETRYRRLFDMVDDAVIVVDEATGRVLEANPNANALLGKDGGSIVGKPFPRGMGRAGNAAVTALLEESRSVGKASTGALSSEGIEGPFIVVANFLRQAGESRFLIRIGRPGGTGEGRHQSAGHYLQEALRRAPDAVIQTDGEGRILAVNQSFLDLAQLASQEQAVGHAADRWLGRSGVDLNVLLTNLREHGTVKLFTSSLRGESGTFADVEVSASRLDDTHDPLYVFFIREIGLRMTELPLPRQLPRSIEQITQRVGRVPLKDLVRESTEVIEAMCIEAALRLTRDNRASAAELLGLSRQSLYAKLRRYHIGAGEDPAAED